MNSFKRQIYKFGQLEENEKNPPTVDDNSAEYTSGIFNFDTSHFTNNFQDKDGDSHELTRVISLPIVGTIKYDGNPIGKDFIFNLSDVDKLTYELPDNYMISTNGYCKFDDPINDIISYQETEGYDLTYLGEGRLEFIKNSTSAITDDTDIYAFFDATSMQIEDSEAAKDALVEWFDDFKSNNDLYTGNLYILPILKESWLDYPNIIQRGSSTRVGNNSDRPNDDYMSFAIIPPNFDLNSNEENPNWTPPTKLVTLAFIDEVAHGTEFYHKDRNGYGFDGQPSSEYLRNYRDFKENYENNFEYFKGIIYPIPDIESGNYNNVGNAMVLQALAAIEGGATYTLEEIEALGVPYATERRFHWHLDPTHNYYSGTHLTIANPYSAEANTPVPNTNYNLQGLKDFGWVGIYDKDQPALDVFTSDTFKSDLNSLFKGSVSSSTDRRVIRGECFSSGEVCFDFKTSDDSEYNLFSNLATFCFTGIDSEENISEFNAPTVDGVNRPYIEGLYTFDVPDFTNNFFDADGDSYEIVKLQSQMMSSKGIGVGELNYNGTPINIPHVFNIVDVNGLTFAMNDTFVPVQDRLYKYENNLSVLINDLENQGYILFDRDGANLEFSKLITSNQESPTVEKTVIKGKDIGNLSICLDFRISDDSSYNLFSNLAQFCFDFENNNSAPTVEDSVDVMSSNEFIFQNEHFTHNFSDNEGDVPRTVRIEGDYIFSEDVLEEDRVVIGELTYEGYNLETPFAFAIGDVNNLKYTLPDRFIKQGEVFYSFDKSVSEIEAEQEPLGYTLISNEEGILTFEKLSEDDVEFKYISGNNVSTQDISYEFRVSDDNENPLFSNVATVTLTVPSKETPIDFNQPPTVGDNEITLE